MHEGQVLNVRMNGSLAFLVALTTVGVGCASRDGVRPEPFPRLPAANDRGTVSTANHDVLTTTALSLIGSPYREGGDSPAGFDCSGFMRYVFARHGVSLPRLAQQQFHVGRPVGIDEIRPGDLVFFTTIAPGASHVGLAIGPDEFVHAPGTRGRVRVERMSAGYWSRRYLGARRVME